MPVLSRPRSESAVPPPRETTVRAELLCARGVEACRRGDRSALRAVLAELSAATGRHEGRRRAILEFCLQQSALGSLDVVSDLLAGLDACAAAPVRVAA